MITLAVALVGAVVAAVGTGMVAARAIRFPRGDLIAVSFALLGLAIGLGAIAVGYLVGFGPATFRTMELGAQVLAPLALCLALAELSGRSVPGRFAGRLLLSALTFIGFVVLSTDALAPDLVFGKTWPDPTRYYETVSNKLLQFGLAPVTAVVALVAIGLAVSRSRRDPSWQGAARTVFLVGAAALALAIPGLAALLTVNFGLGLAFHGSEFAGLCLVAAGLSLFAGLQADRLRLDLLHGGPDDGYADSGQWRRDESWPGGLDQAGDYDPLGSGSGVYRGGGLYRDDPDQDPAGGYPRDDHDQDPGYRGYQHPDLDRDYPDAGPGSPARPGSWAQAAGADLMPETGQFEAAVGPAPVPTATTEQEAREARERMFGQIAIYTLLEDRVDEFDRLTERVVRQVRTLEPGTLVYIVHAVPSAPLQRILYEVYRDRAAYEEHAKQPYVARFEADRRPFVLATNVIELGLQQAKVSAFPSISELLDQTGLSALDYVRPVADSGQPAPGQPDQGRTSARSRSGQGRASPATSRSGQASAGQPGSSWFSGEPEPEPERGRPGSRPSGHLPSGYDQPGYGQPGYEQPGYGQPDYEQRGRRSGYDQPGYDAGDRYGASGGPAGNGAAGYGRDGNGAADYDGGAGHGGPGYDGAGQGPGYDGAGQGPGYDGAGHGPGYDGAGQGPGYDGAGHDREGYGSAEPGRGRGGPDDGSQWHQ